LSTTNAFKPIAHLSHVTVLSDARIISRKKRQEGEGEGWRINFTELARHFFTYASGFDGCKGSKIHDDAVKSLLVLPTRRRISC
jgi:hypothetical protein